MDNSTFLSIVIPIYDPPIDHFRDCVSSIKENLTSETEVIFVDDYSPSKDYLEVIKGLDCKLIVNNKNLHQGLSRQVGLDACSGKYVTFMDQDDTFISGVIPIIIERLKESKCKCQYKTKSRIIGSIANETYDRFCDEMLHGNFFNVDFLRNNDISFSPDLRESSEDTYFMSLIAMIGYNRSDYTLFDDIVTYNWYIWLDSTSHKEGRTFTYFERTFKDYCDAHILTMDWFKRHINNTDYIKIRGAYLYMAFYFTCLVYDYHKEGSIIKQETRRFFIWLLNCMGVTFDDMYDIVIKHPYTYTESYKRMVERNGDIIPYETVREFTDYWKNNIEGGEVNDGNT